ncbi:MAG: hypothetical protein M3332_10580 [Actinomycetota bacterium]|nr:hypothetical protein [Actinomycetota bacterium]
MPTEPGVITCLRTATTLGVEARGDAAPVRNLRLTVAPVASVAAFQVAGQ